MKQADIVVGREYLITRWNDWMVTAVPVTRGKITALRPGGEVQYDRLDVETGEYLDTRTRTTRNVRMEWEPAIALRARNLADLAGKREVRRQEKEALTARNNAVREMLGLETRTFFNQPTVVTMTLAEAEQIVAKMTGTMKLPLNLKEQ